MESVSSEGANPKLEILKNLMSDMGYPICAGTWLFADGFYLTHHTLIWKRHSHTNMTTPTGRRFSQCDELSGLVGCC